LEKGIRIFNPLRSPRFRASVSGIF